MEQIRSHTGLRGLAALLVVFYHLQFLPGHLAWEDLTQLPRRSYLMVDLFFVLSGFIMSYVYTPADGRRLAIVPFALRRLIRLYPLHLFCLAYLVVGQIVFTALEHMSGRPAAGLWSGMSIAQLLSQVLLINAFMPFENGWNIPSWSISAELFAYALFPLAGAWLVRRPAQATAAFLALSCSFYAWVWWARGGSLDITWWPAPLRCLAGFVLGMLVHRHHDLFARIPAAPRAVLQALIVAGVLLVLARRTNDVLDIPLFAGLAAITAADRGWLASLLARKPLQYLGEISYSVYLNHVCVMTFAFPLWSAVLHRTGMDPALGRALFIGLYVASVIAVSHLTHQWVEVPARKGLMRRLQPMLR